MKEFYYSDGLQKYGPFTFEELKQQNISRKTMVWFSGMELWKPAEEIPELQELFTDQPPDLHTAARPKDDITLRTVTRTGRPPRTWLVESILVTVFCCLPFGIAGIVNAAKVETRYSCGDIEGAERSSRQAGTWTQIGFWIGVAVVVAYGAFMIIAIAADL